MAETNPFLSKAFNLGCDARLAGVRLSNCPYSTDDEDRTQLYWRDGWRHVHRNWGKAVARRWPFKPLPPVEVEEDDEV